MSQKADSQTKLPSLGDYWSCCSFLASFVHTDVIEKSMTLRSIQELPPTELLKVGQLLFQSPLD